MNICIIGNSGHWGYAKRELSNHNVVGIAPGYPGDDMAAVQNVLKKVGIYAPIYEDYHTLIGCADVAVINSRFDLNAEIAAQCLDKNVYAFCEKPLATSLGQLAMLRKAQEASAAMVIGMFGIQYSGWCLTVQEAVKSIGQIRMVNSQKSYKLGQRPDFYKNKEQFGGIIPWVAIHAIDWIWAITGAKVETMSAMTDALHNFGNGDLEMTALCQFRLENNILASVNADYYRPLTAPTHDDDRVRVVGTKGIVEYKDGVVTKIGANGIEELSMLPAESIFSLFLRRIGGEDVGITPEESFYLTEIALKARDLADQAR